MSISNIKKINVRSPFYVVVKGTEAEEVTPTETTVIREAFSCGGTKSIGAFVGKKKFDITATGRDNGTYTVSFSGVKFPIKYRIGLASNIDNVSFTTKGLDTYATEWSNAGETAGDLDAAASYPNGLTFDATYTSTNEDAIMLEVYHPVVSTTEYSFSLACPDITAVVEPEPDGFATVFSVIRADTNGVDRSAGAVELNGATLLDPSYNTSNSRTNVYGGTTRAVLTGGTVILPTDNDNFLNIDSIMNVPSYFSKHARVFRNASYSKTNGLVPSPNVETSFPNISIVEGSFNSIRMTGGYLATGSQSFQILITRHPVIDISGTKYIQGCDQKDIKGILATFTFQGGGSSMDFTFKGGNETELSLTDGILGLPQIETPQLEEEGLSPFYYGQSSLVTLRKF